MSLNHWGQEDHGRLRRGVHLQPIGAAGPGRRRLRLDAAKNGRGWVQMGRRRTAQARRVGAQLD